MTKHINIILLGITITIASIFSCDTERDTFKEALSKESDVTLGAAQGVMASYGIGKLKLEIAINADPKLKKFIIKDGEEDLLELDIVRNKPGLDTLTYIVELEEKLFNFSLRTEDTAGNLSIPFEFVATVFGSKFIDELNSRKVDNITFSPNTGTSRIYFSNPEEDMTETALTYTTRTDEQKTIIISNEENNIVVDDYKVNTKFQLVSTYSPTGSGRVSFEDFIATEVNEGTFPLCEGSGIVLTSLEAIDFGEVNQGETATKSFTVQSDDCFIDSSLINAKMGDDDSPYKLSLSMVGPFENSVVLGDISVAKTIYVQFDASTGRNFPYDNTVKIEGTNIILPSVLDITGKEMGNIKTGLNVLNYVEDGPFETVPLYGDVGPKLEWGGLFHEVLFDQNTRSVGHSDANTVPGASFTIDLGKDYDIKQAGWVARTDRCCRALKKYQIWGLPDGIDIADADTTVDPADEAAWSAEMLSKGWRILVNDNLSKNVNSDEHDGRVINDVLPSYSTTRYIRVNVYEAFNQSFFDFGEIELLADFGN